MGQEIRFYYVGGSSFCAGADMGDGTGDLALAEVSGSERNLSVVEPSRLRVDGA